MAWHLALVAQTLLQALQEGTAAGKGDAAIHDVPGQLRRGPVERLLDRGDDVADRLVERLADLLRGQFDGFREAGDEVAAADLGLDLLTATSVVPPPMSTTIEPVGSATGRPAPIAAAIGSSIR